MLPFATNILSPNHYPEDSYGRYYFEEKIICFLYSMGQWYIIIEDIKGQPYKDFYPSVQPYIKKDKHYFTYKIENLSSDMFSLPLNVLIELRKEIKD